MQQTPKHHRDPSQMGASIIQRLNNAFADKLMSTPFPVEILSYQWKQAALDSLRFASPASLGVSAAVFRKLANMVPCDKNYKLNLFEFATLSNHLETRSAFDLGFKLPAYADLMIEAASHVDFYNERATALKKEVEKQIAEEDAMKKAAEQGVGKEPFKAIKGEA